MELARSSWTNFLRFTAMVLIWGSSYMFIRVALDGFSASQIAVGRVLLGSAVLGVILGATQRRLPRGASFWAHMTVVAMCQCSVPFFLLAWAGQYVPSSLSSMTNAVAPTFTVLLTPLLIRSERLARLQILGVAVGIGGVTLLIAPWRLLSVEEVSGTLPAQAALLAAALTYAFGLVYMRKFVVIAEYDAISVAFAQIVLAIVPLSLLIPAATSTLPAPDAASLLALLALGGLGTGIVYAWNARIVRDWGATRTSTVTYLMPVVGVSLGVLVLDESIHWNEPLGGVLILSGVLACQLGRRRPQAVVGSSHATPTANANAS